MKNNPSLLLINPWIIDFAAYNFWAEPLGLLYVGAIAREAGAEVFYIDCLTSLQERNPKPKENGCSKYRRKIITKPECLKFVERNYALYGMSEEEFLNRLARISQPDAVLVTSIMTYWYPGVFKVIDLVRRYYGNRIPVIAGGIYARLSYNHAKSHSMADSVFIDEDLRGLLRLIESLTHKRFNRIPEMPSFSEYPIPLHELQQGKHFFSLLTRQGCPYNCCYCASGILNKTCSTRPITSIMHEITEYTARLNVRNISFYDDALLVGAEDHIIPLLDEIRNLNINLAIHLPNGIHCRFLTRRLAGLLRDCGVKTIRIGLETADEAIQRRTGNKITNRDYRTGVQYLREAGYSRQEIGTYVMIGFPGQHIEEVEKTIDFVYETGGAPALSYFSPIPGTKIWHEAVKSTPFPIETEPLFQNNTVYILGSREFSEKTVMYLKAKAIELRKRA